MAYFHIVAYFMRIIANNVFSVFKHFVADAFQFAVAAADSAVVKRYCQQSCVIVRLDNVYYNNFTVKFFSKALLSARQDVSEPSTGTRIFLNILHTSRYGFCHIFYVLKCSTFFNKILQSGKFLRLSFLAVVRKAQSLRGCAAPAAAF